MQHHSLLERACNASGIAASSSLYATSTLLDKESSGDCRDEAQDKQTAVQVGRQPETAK